MTRDLVVGIFFLTAIFLVGVITLRVTGIPAGSVEYRLDVRFDDVSGLQRGNDVRIRGYKSGEVEEIEFTEDVVTVTLLLYKEITPKEGYSFEVLPSSPLGGTYVRYSPGKGEPAERPLAGRAGSELFSEMAEILNENRDNIRESIASLESLLEKIDNGDGLVAALFNDQAIRDDIASSFDGLSLSMERIVNAEGTLGALITDGELRDDVRSTIEGMRASIEQIQSGEGAVGALIYDPEMKNSLQRVFERTDRITADIENAKGLVGALLHDEVLKQYFEDFARGASNLVEELREGQGPIARLIYDQELGEEVAATVREISDITGRIRNGPGTAYSLVYDETLYQRASEAAALLRDTTEDAREQAPISSFFGILFAPF